MILFPSHFVTVQMEIDFLMNHSYKMSTVENNVWDIPLLRSTWFKTINVQISTALFWSILRTIEGSLLCFEKRHVLILF